MTTDYLKSCYSLCRLFGHAAQNELKICKVALQQQPNVAAFIILVKFFLLLYLLYLLLCATI